MLYRPNYCCNCGEKIERVEWNLLTSRRFCEVCSIEKRAYDIVPRLAVAAGALAMMFGFGSLWTGSGRAEPKATESAVGVRSGLPAAVPAQPSGKVNEPGGELVQTTNGQIAEQARTEPTVATVAEKNSDKYFCGALTKKGTACSRKVKAKGVRCFQHEGRPEAPQSE
jgi:hypothetical protein